MSEPRTLPQYFLAKVKEAGADQVAMRQKELGIWREFSWSDSYQEVKHFALGLIDLGLRRGDHVATVGDNDRYYYWSYLALLAAGAVQVGLFTDANGPEAAYVVSHSDARFVLAKDQEQVDKMLAVREQIPGVEVVIYWDERGLWNYDEPWLLSYDEVTARGRALEAREPERFEREVALGQADDTAVLCYTSGTTGRPKGAMLSHGNLIASALAYQSVDPRYPTDNYVSLLPMGWIGEHALGVAPHVIIGLVVNFPEEPETVRANVREVAPEGILYNSRLWDLLVSDVQARIKEAPWLYRKLYDWFVPVGYRVADRRLAGESVGPLLQMAYGVGEFALFAPIRDQLGLSNVRAAYTAGAALSPDAVRFFHALGINLKQIYGSTEVTGGATLHYDGDIKFASVGRAVPGIELRIAEDDEIQIRGGTLFQGYYKNPEATREALADAEDGQPWFRSGDAGYIDEDGHLIYLDRVKDLLTLANGERFSPQFIEGRLKFSPYISDVMAIGGETRPFVTALVIIDFTNTGSWAERQGIGYTTFEDLAQKPQVYALVREAVAGVNASLPDAARVRRFVLLHKSFDADEAEVTRSRKLRRGFLYERYAAIVEALYGDGTTVHVATQVQYQDGSAGAMANDLRIETV